MAVITSKLFYVPPNNPLLSHLRITTITNTSLTHPTRTHQTPPLFEGYPVYSGHEWILPERWNQGNSEDSCKQREDTDFISVSSKIIYWGDTREQLLIQLPNHIVGECTAGAETRVYARTDCKTYVALGYFLIGSFKNVSSIHKTLNFFILQNQH